MADFEQAYYAYIKKLQERVIKQVEQMQPEITRKFNELLTLRIKQIYDYAIWEFYSDYEPHLYQRNFSLYNLLEAKTSGSRVSISVDDEKMTPGGGLFDTVFNLGWHGGAINKDGDGSTRYYRYPPANDFTKDGRPKGWNYWGDQAARAEISPSDAFQKGLDEYRESDEISEDYSMIAAPFFRRIKL